MRLLVIEDEKRLAGMLADLLHRQGYTVDVSNDGVSGLDNALSGIYDLVVLDVMLPGMDGFELLRRLRGGEELYSRENPAGHLTASAWVVSPDRTQVLMAYHNLYNSWAWLGGHADGDRDLCGVALRETGEESGLMDLRLLTPEIFSLETLTVDGHIKRGSYVSSHLHLNVTYLLEADPREPLRMKPDENSGVAWFPVSQVAERVTEPWMNRWVYQKLMERVRALGA